MSAQRRPDPQRPVDPIVAELRDWRIEQGISQAELAARFGAKQRALAAWELGVNPPDLPTVRRWAAALDAALTLSESADGSADAYRRGWNDCAHAARSATTWSDS